MSEPVSNVEIEDVLSSIRRLVSEENRPAARRDPEESPRKPSRLVLTPSLLVPVRDVDDPAVESAEETPEEIADDQAADHADTAGVDSFVSEPDAPVTLATQETGEAQPDQAPDGQDEITISAQADTLDLADFESDSGSDGEFDVEAETPTDIDTDTDTDTDTEMDADAAPWADPESTLFQAAESATGPELMDIGEDTGAEQDQGARTSETTQSDPADDGHIDDTADLPDTGPDTAPDTMEPDTMEPDVVTGPQGDGASDQNTTEDSAPEDLAPQETSEPYNTATLSAKIAVLEAQIGQTQDQWEPDGETDDDYAGTPVETIAWQDHTEDAPDPAPTPEPEIVTPVELGPDPVPDPTLGASAGETLDFLPEDEAILDEDSLRELVSDIVRQELQGALGERITRNVRKLVRREIHRALTAQELD